MEVINKRKSCNKKLNKHVAVFDYIAHALIVLRAASGGISICSFTSIVGAPVGISSASFNLLFCLTTGITKKLTRKNKKKQTWQNFYVD